MMTEEQKQDLIADAQATIELFESVGSTEQIVYKLAKIALAALTQPASPDYFINRIEFTDAYSPDVELRVYESELDAKKPKEDHGGDVIPVYLNAPHTAPIEPTGGAEWVKCSDRMPPKGKPGTSREYLVYETLNNRVQHDYYNIPEKMPPFWNHYGKHVTHWMPLPAAPEEE